MNRRDFLAFAAAPCALAQQPNPEPKPELNWTSILDLGIEGKGWSDTAHPFDRLPAKAESMVRPPVWGLAHDSAGMLTRFTSATPSIRARWTLRKDKLALPHMPATGVSGLDLYVRFNGRWRWLANGRPERLENEQTLFARYSGPPRDYLLYLPLYNGVESVMLGIPKDATLAPSAPPRGRKPILFYGSSILQGGCASRPGMAYPSIIGRMLNCATINLGFSGNGLSEPEIATLQAELDPSIYVYDSLPNMQPQQVTERTESFLKTLRKAHPATPIVLVENAIYTNFDFIETVRTRITEKNRLMRAIYEKLVKEGDKKLTYIPAKNLYGDDGEATVDGTHPTDVGFLRMAQTIAPVLRPLLA